MGGVVDLLIYHIYTIFGYWPFSKIACILWSSLDSSLNLLTLLHMLYLTWARIKSILKPRIYTESFLVKRPYQVLICIWIFSVSVWSSINLTYIWPNYPMDQCYIPYNPPFMEFILDFLLWLIPLFLIF